MSLFIYCDVFGLMSLLRGHPVFLFYEAFAVGDQCWKMGYDGILNSSCKHQAVNFLPDIIKRSLLVPFQRNKSILMTAYLYVLCGYRSYRVGIGF